MKASGHLRIRWVISALLLVFPISASSARAQDDDITAAVTETLAAWGAGDFDKFAAFYHPEARGFFLDGGPMITGFDVAPLEAAHEAGLRTRIELSDVKVQRYGSLAVTAALLRGTVTLPNGMEIPGAWRYTETRILEEGVWRIVQYHFSEQAADGAP